jgi:hypothetical protein
MDWNKGNNSFAQRRWQTIRCRRHKEASEDAQRQTADSGASVMPKRIQDDAWRTGIDPVFEERTTIQQQVRSLLTSRPAPEAGEAHTASSGNPQILELHLFYTYVESIILLQRVQRVCRQHHILRHQNATPLHFIIALSIALNVDAVYVKRIIHGSVLRVFKLQHLL